jgi:hypothetical protein
MEGETAAKSADALRPIGVSDHHAPTKGQVACHRSRCKMRTVLGHDSPFCARRTVRVEKFL